MLFLDGVYVDGPHGLARFRWVKAPTSEELCRLAHTIAHRVGRFLERKGLLERDMENRYLASDAWHTWRGNPLARKPPGHRAVDHRSWACSADLFQQSLTRQAAPRGAAGGSFAGYLRRGLIRPASRVMCAVSWRFAGMEDGSVPVGLALGYTSGRAKRVLVFATLVLSWSNGYRPTTCCPARCR